MVPLGDKSFWPEVGIAVPVRAPLVKRPVGRQRKNRMKGCLEGGSGKKKSGKERKTKKLFRGQFQCPNCGELGHRKNSPKCYLNGTKKCHCSCDYTYNILVEINNNLINVLIMQETEIEEKEMVPC
jgi:hypothetical protein